MDPPLLSLLKNNPHLFYRFIYELDRRHKIELRGRNVVRQGVQWGEAEMAEARRELQEEVDAMTDPAKKKAREEEVAAWYDLQNTPPMRRVELAHRAQFRQLVNTHG
jgi:hypothetical protein